MSSDRFSLDPMDIDLIKELENDPLASNTDLGMRLYSNRNSVAKRIQELQDRQIISISVIRSMTEFGHRILFYLFIKAETDKVLVAAESLSQHASIEQINISAGQYNIMAIGRFCDSQDFLDFQNDGIGSIPEIISCQTMMVLTTAKTNYPYVEQYVNAEEPKTTLQIDDLDLRIIDELIKKPRQSHTDIAKQLGVVRQTISRKINGLIRNHVIAVVTYASPVALGYQTVSVILLKVRPSVINKVSKRLADYPEIQDVIIGTGCYDIICFAVFRNADEMSSLIEKKIVTDPDVISQEAITIESGVKSSLGLLI